MTQAAICDQSSEEEDEADLDSQQIVPFGASSSAGSQSPPTPGSAVSEVSSIGTSVSRRGQGEKGKKKKKEVHGDTFVNRVSNIVGKQTTPERKKRKVPKAPPATKAMVAAGGNGDSD